MVKSIFQGMLIGIAGIMPGVSGGTLAISMGIYDKLIRCITHIFKDLKESIRFLMPISVGMAISLTSLSFIMEIAFDTVPVSMGGLFTGLVAGGIPDIWKKACSGRIKKGHIITSIMLFLVITLLSLYAGTENSHAVLYGSVADRIRLFGVGIIASAGMVIPGVSGSVILLILGYYTTLIIHINTFIKHIFSLEIYKCIMDFIILLPFVLGISIGSFAIAGIIEFIFNRMPVYAYWGIIGIIASSIVSIAATCFFSGNSIRIYDIIISVPSLALGAIVAAKLGG